MPEPLALEAGLDPKKKRNKAAKFFDAANDAPGASKPFKLYEDSTVAAPGASKPLKLCEDSTVAAGPSKRLKLAGTDDSGRAAI